MESRECLARCRTRSIARRSNDLRGCCRSRCDSSGNSKARRLEIYTPDRADSRRPGGKEEEVEEAEERNDETVHHYDKFALAKRLHAENLQHQPLPDRVDDRVFRNAASAAHGHRPCSANCGIEVRNAFAKGNRFFGPSLGCREPKTRMDLAICWETPIDPVYEPRRSTHIDGSEGGSAPAIFALIQHTSAPKNHELLPRLQEAHADDGCDCAGRTDSKRRGNRCCCDRLCNGMKTIAMAEAHGEKTRSSSAPPLPSSSPPRITERKCVACKPTGTAVEKEIRDPRLIRSAVGVTLGLEKRSEGSRRNGLPPAKFAVPRPRTPFARRSFCIDTLAPPFSVVDGCRDADYPEHWRLMSVYQQSYKNPQRRKIRYS